MDIVAERYMDSQFESSTVEYQNGLGIDNKLEGESGIGESQYYLQDHLGSTNGLTDSTGAITSQTSYDSFGNQTGNLNTRYQFTGREKNDVTGLYYYRARWYDSKLGRFISEDPIGFGGGDVNLFGYVGNNPIMLKDPKGKNPLVVIGVIGGLAIGEGILHNYLAGESGKFFNSGNDPQGRKRHCYVNCMSIRYHLGGIGPSTIISLGQEAGGFATAVINGDNLSNFYDDSMGDMRANFRGQRYGYILWRNCEDLCKDCQ
jgi:RHS repeat-associated protein